MKLQGKIALVTGAGSGIGQGDPRGQSISNKMFCESNEADSRVSS